jgi:hypothetical protein
METMPRPRPPHLLREVSRHGTVSWVVRVGHGPRIHLRAAYSTPEFEAEYIRRHSRRARQRPAQGRAGLFQMALGALPCEPGLARSFGGDA